MKNGQNLHLVVTISRNFKDQDTYSDIIGCFSTHNKAVEICHKVKNRLPIPNLNYDYLVEFDDVAIILIPFNATIHND